MPTYEYECTVCGHRFEALQAMSEAPRRACPKCGGKGRRRISAGTAVIVKQGASAAPGCAFHNRGRTCCGRDEPCQHPGCEE
jgi:putative FmdB family regulatory protein